MAKLKIRNFGPIQNGFSENDGFLEISPVTVICGNKYNKLTDDGTGIFSGEVTIPKNVKEISIGVSNKENSSYQIYANYVVK